MLKYILYFSVASTLFVSCGVSNPEEPLTKEQVPAPESTENVVFPTRIKGKAGYIYVDAKGMGTMPIVFAHSFGGSGEHWKNQVEHLKDKYRVVTFDFRGHGRSDSATAEVYSPADMAEDIEAVAEIMDLDKFVLVGHSMGGSAAVAYTAKHPKKVAGLVLVGTPGKGDPQQGEKIMASLKSPRYQKVMDDYMKQLLKNAKPEVNDQVMQEFHKLSRPVSIAVTGSIFDFDPLPALEKYKGPLLVVATEKESQQPQALGKQVKDAKTIVITGTSHWIQLDKPEEFNKVLDDFLEENKL